ncbi:DUF805 domain-containing protein [Bifidobacterium callitrichos]|uniref:DUF805 domain-containing protein n=1 Tax=Bifidobacterium callitrichos DSM 23973 TaxID=1437609 RepID=A0A087A6V0_9BIFI|nr:DUF805 domain-containing protein [Bifidobacterium callitrichos]KFI54500.1 hypothetical protein BCAL_1436 [Bifidobacterium callitrichos DSM 23973]
MTNPFTHDSSSGSPDPDDNAGGTANGMPPSYPPDGTYTNPYADPDYAGPAYAGPTYTNPNYGNPNDFGGFNAEWTDRGGPRRGSRTGFGPNDARTSTAPGTDAPPLHQPYYGCPPQEAFLRFFKKYVTVSGRASRSEYWWWMLIAFGIALMLRFLANATDGALGFLGTIWTLGTLVPGFAIAIRRLHDSNRPGWLVTMPYALGFGGAIIIIVGAASALSGALGALGSDGSGGHVAAGVGGGIAFLVGIVVVLAGVIVNIVLMLAPSRPEGARFDAV